MGGNALNFQTRRVESATEFRTLVVEVLHTLTHELGWHAAPVRWYHTKESFGDMDILVDSDTIDPNWVDVVLEKFQPKDHFKNGSCLSFDYKDVQVDLILAPAKEFNFSYYYFAWNDLGNFVGRTAHRLGFKFGHDGLWYVLRDPKDYSRVIKEILVTQDFDLAVNFLGYRSQPFKIGFDTPNDIYQFVTTSPYFDPRQFLLVNRSYAARVRDKKRKMYTGMLEFIRQNYPEIPEDCDPMPIDRNEHLARAFNDFPEFKERYDSTMNEFHLDCKFKEKFNGKFVGKLFGLRGKELGECMTQMRQTIEKYDLRQFIIDLDDRQVKDFFILIAE